MLNFQEFLIEARLSVDDARAILNLKIGFSPEELKRAYRVAAKSHHPDAGGSSSDMITINAAYSKLKSVISAPEKVVTPATTSATIVASDNMDRGVAQQNPPPSRPESETDKYRRMRRAENERLAREQGKTWTPPQKKEINVDEYRRQREEANQRLAKQQGKIWPFSSKK